MEGIFHHNFPLDSLLAGILSEEALKLSRCRSGVIWILGMLTGVCLSSYVEPVITERARSSPR